MTVHSLDSPLGERNLYTCSPAVVALQVYIPDSPSSVDVGTVLPFCVQSTLSRNVLPSLSVPVIVSTYSSPALAEFAITSISTLAASPCTTVILTVSEILYPPSEIAHALISQTPTSLASHMPEFPIIMSVILVSSMHCTTSFISTFSQIE